MASLSTNIPPPAGEVMPEMTSNPLGCLSAIKLGIAVFCVLSFFFSNSTVLAFTVVLLAFKGASARHR